VSSSYDSIAGSRLGLVDVRDEVLSSSEAILSEGPRVACDQAAERIDVLDAASVGGLLDIVAAPLNGQVNSEPVNSELVNSEPVNSEPVNSEPVNSTRVIGGQVGSACTVQSPAAPVSSSAVSPSAVSPSAVSPSAVSSSAVQRRLNRVAEVRCSQGISDRSMCKRLNIDLGRLRELEDPCRDLSISELMLLQTALEVPLVDLIEDSNSMSRPTLERAKMVRVMKTASAIGECKLTVRAQRLAQMLKEQLIELMPELSEVSPWPQFGSRRSSDSVARVLSHEINTSHLHHED
jgi:hypothetical protein